MESLGGIEAADVRYVVNMYDSCPRSERCTVLATSIEKPGCTCSMYANSNDGMFEGT